MSKQTVFQEDWLHNPQFSSWLKKVPLNNKVAECKVCCKKFDLSNMGRRAVTSHMQGAKHKKNISAVQKSTSLKCFVKEESSSVVIPIIGEESKNASDESARSSGSNAAVSPAIIQFSEQQTATRGLNAFIVKDSVTEAEILWCIESVITHTSLRTAGRHVLLFKRMFPNCEIAQKMQLQRDKVGYLIAYGIAPYFQNELIQKLNKSDFLTVGFDESLNKIAQKQQMDINVRFWDESLKEVRTRYLTSVFLGRSRASDLLFSLKEGLKVLDVKKIIQVSMDGPNVNFKLVNDLKAEINTDVEDKKILDLGSCGLHTLHNAFKSAIRETGWEIVPFLRALYNLFKDSPARRAIFASITQSAVFPKKFCAVRWLQNVEVAQRAIDLLPHIKSFVDEMEKTKGVASQSYELVKEAISDPLLHAKLEFFKGLASDVEPFLKHFQSDEPLAPFLHAELTTIILTQMERFVKSSVMAELKDVKDFKVDTKSLLPAAEINIGISTKNAIHKANKSVGKIKDASMLKFREGCKEALVKFVAKMLEKSPLNYKLTRAISCFDPKVAENHKIGKKRMEVLLTILLDKNLIHSSSADRCMRDYERLCNQSNVVSSLKAYQKERLDSFWANLIDEKSHLYEVLKIVCTLSHGNANVERGFSVNAECIVENMREELLIARRAIYDGILSIGGIDQFKIEKPLIHAARNAYSRYAEALRLKKNQQTESALQSQKRRLDVINLKELQNKKRKILEDAQREAECINAEIEKLIKH